MMIDILEKVDILMLEYYEEYFRLPDYVVLSPTMKTLIETSFLSNWTASMCLATPKEPETFYGMRIIVSPKVKTLEDIEVY